MNIIWAPIIAAVGALFITWGRTKSNLGLYTDSSSPAHESSGATESTASTKSPAPSRSSPELQSH